MANVKISELPAATVPLAGSELVPVVQSGTTDQVTVANLTAGRTVSVAALTATGTVSGATVTASGTVSGATVTASGTVSGATVSGTTVTASGTVSGATVSGTTVVAGAGSVAAPSISPTGDSNTGLFFPDADTVAIAAGGVESLRLNSSGQAVHAAGTASLPAVTVTGDRNTGIYFPGADRIGFAEGGVQAGEFDASGNFLFNSGYGSVAVGYGCRAWVNFNGTGTVAIRASGNVSSITDLGGNGAYTINFANAMPDANFSTQVSIGPLTGGFNTGVAERHIISGPASSSVTVYTADVATGLTDSPLICVAIFR